MATHSLTVADGLVTKRYRSWSRGEPLREWTILRHLSRWAPGLAPCPVSAALAGEPPAVTMTRLPGSPLTADRWDIRLVAPLARALGELWSVPLVGVPGTWPTNLAFARLLLGAPRPEDPVLAEAYDAGRAWWSGPDIAVLSRRPAHLVLGHRDPNITNYLWDGARIRVVDLEDAGISDPATELAMLLEHLSWRPIDPTPLLAALPAVDPERLRAARRLWSLYWLTLLLPGGPAVPRNPPNTPHEQATRVLHLLSTAGM